MTHPENYYWEIPLVRSLDEILQCVRQQKYSCVHPPLLNIDVHNVVPDELHLMLRITGKTTCSSYIIQENIIIVI